MKLLLVGAPRPLHTNRWKDDIAEAAELLGWDVNHVPARIPAADIVQLAKGCDLLLWARTPEIDPIGDMAGALRRVEDAGTITVGLHLDLYWGIRRREAQIGFHPFWSCQYVFTADGGSRPWRSRNVNHYWLPPPMGHRFFGRGEPDDRFRHSAVFVGGVIRDIHGLHRQQLIAWARRTWGPGFVHYSKSVRPCWGSNLNVLYASTPIVLGDSAPAPYYWSDRIPLTLGRGGLLAHPRTPGLEEQGFTDDCMVLYDRFDFAGLGRKLRELSPAQRREITDNALTVVRERHMWTHRLEQIVKVVGLS